MNNLTRDIHAEMAAKLFNIPEDQLTENQREVGKRANHMSEFRFKIKQNPQQKELPKLEFTATRVNAFDELSDGEKLLRVITNYTNSPPDYSEILCYLNQKDYSIINLGFNEYIATGVFGKNSQLAFHTLTQLALNHQLDYAAYDFDRNQ